MNKEEVRYIIESEWKECETVVEGIKLSPSETKVIDSLCNLLHEKQPDQRPREA